MTEQRLRQIIREELASFLSATTVKTELTVEEFAEFMHWSLAYTRSKMVEIPHTKVGKRNVILKSKAVEYRKRVHGY